MPSSARWRAALCQNRGIVPGAEPTILAAALRRLRERRELSQEALAYASGLPLEAIEAFEQSAERPSWDALLWLAHGLELPVIAIAEEYERSAASAGYPPNTSTHASARRVSRS